MLDKLIGFLLGLREAGKEISTKNAAQLQSIHDTAAGMLGLDCGAAPMSEAQRTTRMQEAWRSYSETQQAVWEAIEEMSPGICGWIRDIWDDKVVYSAYGDGESALYQVGYSIDAAGKVTLSGTPVAVRSVTTYEPVPAGVEPPEEDDLSESAILPVDTSTAIPLVESAPTPLTEAIRDDGTVPVKIISPGWGASAYYPADVLKRDGPKLFAAGTHTYWNHPTLTESVERPERDLTTLAGALSTDARYLDDGPDGPGLYADTFVAEGYRSVINDLAPHIGMSIIASGYADEGTIEGRAGKILTGFLFDEHAPPSVDFVTRPGAGGKVISLFEAARPATQEQPHMDVKELEARIAALETQNASLREAADGRAAEASRLREADTLRHVREIVNETLMAEDLLPQTRARLLAEAVKQPPMAGDVLDESTLRERTQDLIRKEMAYLASATGSGRISGMGEGTPKQLTEADIQVQLASVFGAIGMSESGAKLAALGRRG